MPKFPTLLPGFWTCCSSGVWPWAGKQGTNERKQYLVYVTKFLLLIPDIFYYRGYLAIAQPGMGREKGLWIRFLWHVVDWPQLELGQDHSLTDFSGCWLPYLAHIPRAKLIARFGVYLRIKFFLRVKLAEAEQLLLSCRAWCRVHLPETLQGCFS